MPFRAAGSEQWLMEKRQRGRLPECRQWRVSVSALSKWAIPWICFGELRNVIETRLNNVEARKCIAGCRSRGAPGIPILLSGINPQMINPHPYPRTTRNSRRNRPRNKPRMVSNRVSLRGDASHVLQQNPVVARGRLLPGVRVKVMNAAGRNGLYSPV